MDEISSTTDLLTANEADSRKLTINVIRDNTFNRSVADEGLAINLGRDIEFAFLQGGQIINNKSIREVDEETQEEGFTLSAVLTEVSRIRMGHNSAMMFALSIIDVLAEAGRIKPDGIRSSFEKILEKVDSHFKSIPKAGDGDEDE